MPAEYNHAAHELAKLDGAADSYGVKIDSRYDGPGGVGGETRWMRLTSGQKDQIAELLISFNL